MGKRQNPLVQIVFLVIGLTIAYPATLMVIRGFEDSLAGDFVRNIIFVVLLASMLVSYTTDHFNLVAATATEVDEGWLPRVQLEQIRDDLARKRRGGAFFAVPSWDLAPRLRHNIVLWEIVLVALLVLCAMQSEGIEVFSRAAFLTISAVICDYALVIHSLWRHYAAAKRNAAILMLESRGIDCEDLKCGSPVS